MKQKILIFVLTLILCSAGLKAQNYDISVSEIFSAKSDSLSGGQWQYLTSDVYLMNMQTLDKLVDEVFFRNNEKRKKTSLKSVFISGRFDGTAVMSGISYPLYYFKAGGKDGSFSSVKNNNSALRVLDRIPIAAAMSDHIESVVSMKMQMQEGEDIVSSFISGELKLLSSNTVLTPVILSKTYTKEIAELLSQKESGMNAAYSFGSQMKVMVSTPKTQPQIYSVSVFYFKPASSESDITLGPQVREGLSKLLEENPQTINPGRLSDIMGYQNYPYIVCVNYKAKYEVALERDFTDERFAVRAARLKEAFNQGALNSEVFTQEKELNGFLSAYASLKRNAKTATGHFYILRDYNQLCSVYAKVKKEYDGDGVFEECFKDTYESFMKDAQENILGSGDLQGVKTIVSMLENPAKISSDYEECEKNLSLLKSFKYPDDGSDESLKIKDLISRTENSVFESFYSGVVSAFEKAPSFFECQRLMSLMDKTKCEKCYFAMKKAVDKFKNDVNSGNVPSGDN